MIARKEELKPILVITQEIRSAMTRIEKWPSCFRQATAARKDEKRKEDEKALLTRAELREIVLGKVSMEMQAKFLKLEGQDVS